MIPVLATWAEKESLHAVYLLEVRQDNLMALITLRYTAPHVDWADGLSSQGPYKRDLPSGFTFWVEREHVYVDIYALEKAIA